MNKRNYLNFLNLCDSKSNTGKNHYCPKIFHTFTTMKTGKVSYNYKLVANRYYNPRISQFYATDPLAEKYPNFSPYTYTADNPVMLVDPDGKDWVYNKKTKKYYWDKNVKSKKDIRNHKLYRYIGIKYAKIKIDINKHKITSYTIDRKSFLNYFSNEIIKNSLELLDTGKPFSFKDIRGYKENKNLIFQKGNLNKDRTILPVYYKGKKIGGFISIKLLEDNNYTKYMYRNEEKYGATIPFQLFIFNSKYNLTDGRRNQGAGIEIHYNSEQLYRLTLKLVEKQENENWGN